MGADNEAQPPELHALTDRILDDMGGAGRWALISYGREAMERIVLQAMRVGARLEAALRSGDRACRICGCTTLQACVVDDTPCHWVESDLCSACEPYAYGGRR